MSAKVRIFRRGDRGFHGYGKPFKDTYGATIGVYESSSAQGPHVWLSIDVNKEAFAHLNKKQAEKLIARLQTWIDEIPKRWGS